MNLPPFHKVTSVPEPAKDGADDLWSASRQGKRDTGDNKGDEANAQRPLIAGSADDENSDRNQKSAEGDNLNTPRHDSDNVTALSSHPVVDVICGHDLIRVQAKDLFR